jgi:hypothetical protein
MSSLQRPAHQRPFRQQHAPCYTTATANTTSDARGTSTVEHQQTSSATSSGISDSVSGGWWMDVLKQTLPLPQGCTVDQKQQQQQEQHVLNSSGNITASSTASSTDWWTDLLKQTTTTTEAMSIAECHEQLHSSQTADDTQLTNRCNVAVDTSKSWWEQLLT